MFRVASRCRQQFTKNKQAFAAAGAGASFSSQAAEGSSGTKRWAAALGVPLLILGGVFYNQQKKKNAAVSDAAVVVKEEVKSTEPAPKPVVMITLDQMKQMCEKENRIVVSFRGGVFDVTDFTGHPGGYGRLQMAAGQDLEVFWRVYMQHNRGHVEDLLQRYRIGSLSPEDHAKVLAETRYDSSYYANDPPTSPHLYTNTRYPYNAEGKLRELRENFITPAGRHFVRNHCAVPDIDPEEYRLLVTGNGCEDTSFTLEQLKAFPKVSVTSVVQCNGNRREDYHLLDGETPAFGPPHWVCGAISCSTWTGVRMRDVLAASGLDVDTISLNKASPPGGANLVGLTGYDIDEVGNQYCCSFPFEKAIDPYGDVIVAYEMNGQPIPRSHGFPVRAIVPGNAGARNCKFLERITITTVPCADSSNWKQYAVHAPDVPLHKLMDFEVFHKELKQDPPVMEMPVQSMITSPSAGDVLAAVKCGDKVHVKGIAWGGGGSGINRVDVSLDGGKNFTKAECLEQPIPKQRRGSQWAWVFFEQDIPIPEELCSKIKNGEPVKLELTSKALNTSWNAQPENPQSNYNAHGCCVNHWYRVPVTVCPKTTCDVRPDVGAFGNRPSGGEFRAPFDNLDTPDVAQAKRAAAVKKA